MSMITATVWVPRGSAAAFPTKYDVDEKELARISNLAKLHLDDAKDDYDVARGEHNDRAETEDLSDAEQDTVVLPRSKEFEIH